MKLHKQLTEFIMAGIITMDTATLLQRTMNQAHLRGQDQDLILKGVVRMFQDAFQTSDDRYWSDFFDK